VSQINPFRGVVIPSTRPPAVQVHKDRQQRRDGQKHEQPPPEQSEPQPPTTPDDGKPHLDLKA
jgi:hypothetical protein